MSKIGYMAFQLQHDAEYGVAATALLAADAHRYSRAELVDVNIGGETVWSLDDGTIVNVSEDGCDIYDEGLDG